MNRYDIYLNLPGYAFDCIYDASSLACLTNRFLCFIYQLRLACHFAHANPNGSHARVLHSPHGDGVLIINFKGKANNVRRSSFKKGGP